MNQIHFSVVERVAGTENGAYYCGKDTGGHPKYCHFKSFAKNFTASLAPGIALRLTKGTGNVHKAVKIKSKAKKNKYNAQKIMVDGHTFDSKKEARRYGELKILEKAGKIFDLELQKVFKFPLGDVNMRYCRSKTGRLGREIVYIADFFYKTLGPSTGWELITVEDTKGMITDVAKLKLALMMEINGIEVQIL